MPKIKFQPDTVTMTTRKDLMDRYMRMLITKREAARELGGISCSTLDRMRKEGLIVSKKIGGRIMFSVDEICRAIVEG